MKIIGTATITATVSQTATTAPTHIHNHHHQQQQQQMKCKEVKPILNSIVTNLNLNLTPSSIDQLFFLHMYNVHQQSYMPVCASFSHAFCASVIFSHFLLILVECVSTCMHTMQPKLSHKMTKNQKQWRFYTTEPLVKWDPMASKRRMQISLKKNKIG